MRRKLCSIGQVEIYYHPALVVFTAYAFLIGQGRLMICAVISVLLHESAHAVAASLLGQHPQYIELTPLGAMMMLEDEMKLGKIRRFIVLMAGPALSFVICYAMIELSSCGMINQTLGHMLFACNLGILMINLIPALPLDGGRILVLVLEFIFPSGKVYSIMKFMGSLIGLLLIILNVYVSVYSGGWNLSLACAGCCLLYAAARATTSKAMAELRAIIDRKIFIEKKGCIGIKAYMVTHSKELRKLVSNLPTRRYAVFHCIENGSMKYIGWMDESMLIEQYFIAPEQTISEAIKNYKLRMKTENQTQYEKVEP